MSSPFASIPRRAWVLLPLLACCWGATWPMMKIGTAEIPVLTFRALTAVIAGAALMIATAARYRTVLPRRDEWGRLLLCAPINVTAWFYFSALAVTLLPAGRAALLAYTMPLWAFIIGVLFLKEPILKRRVLGVVAGVGAILLMAWDGIEGAVGRAAETAWGMPTGILAITAAAIAWSIGSTLQKEVRFESPVMPIAAWQLAIGAIPLTALALVLEPLDWVGAVGTGPLLATLGVSLISQATGMWIWFTMLQITSMAFASLAVLAVPLVGMGLSAAFLGEPLGLVEMAGFLLITVGLATVLPLDRLFGRRRPPPA
ncbi:DMT family transporter [Marivibrio halodurans]|uniref:DMT family transporter n=1 Tax=Marivibrio halodurans TaxID=2039722 RepID=A0A8J7RWS8_9PROT|nr:DMT family transporter [Marivibrio halodurans]MBP5855950.1 DMT family transporter [Marivibrio halodurans]